MKKNLVGLLIVSTVLFTSCTNEPEKKVESQFVKVDKVDDSCSKVEVILPKGGTIVFTSSSRISDMKGSKTLDPVTVYRVIGYSKTWIVDNEFPERKIDTTIITFYDGNLRKIQYRQGYIAAIYK